MRKYFLLLFLVILLSISVSATKDIALITNNPVTTQEQGLITLLSNWGYTYDYYPYSSTMNIIYGDYDMVIMTYSAYNSAFFTSFPFGTKPLISTNHNLFKYKLLSSTSGSIAYAKLNYVTDYPYITNGLTSNPFDAYSSSSNFYDIGKSSFATCQFNRVIYDSGDRRYLSIMDKGQSCANTVTNEKMAFFGLYQFDKLSNEGRYLLKNTIEWMLPQSSSDSDNDGVIDTNDLCPNTPIGQIVDLNGCSSAQRDADSDGIKDNLDICPNTPTGETPNAQGCSCSQRDTDSDSVNDCHDLCANTPIGSLVDLNGCSSSQRDTDGDTIMDNIDQCPNTPQGETPNANGCSCSQRDTDSDSVNDCHDLCPNTLSGSVVDATGCVQTPTDSDGDGVPNDIDDCPNQVGPASNNGCPIVINDTDGDGIPDSSDQCITIAGTAQYNGCPYACGETECNPQSNLMIWIIGSIAILALIISLVAIIKKSKTKCKYGKNRRTGKCKKR